MFKFKRFFSFRKKLLLSFGVLFTSSLLVIEAVTIYGFPPLSYDGLYDLQKRQAYKELSTTADTKKDLLLNWLNERRMTLQTFSEDDGIQDAIEKINLKISGQKTEKWSQLKFKEFLSTIPEWSWLNSKINRIRTININNSIDIVSVQNGRVIACSDHTHEGTFRKQDKSYIDTLNPLNTEIIHSSPDIGGENYIYISRPLYAKDSDKTHVLGVITINTKADTIIRAMVNTGITPGSSAEVVLFDREEFPLTSLKHLGRDGNPIPPMSKRLEMPTVKMANAGGEGIISTTDYRDVPVLAAYRHLRISSTVAWGMVVKIDSSEVFSGINKTIFVSLLIGLLGCLIVLLLSYFIADQLTIPIAQLHKTAKAVKSGDLTARAKINSQDEFGNLAESFDDMVDKIQNWQQTLEEQVKARTEQLESTREQFRQSQKMEAIGRLAGGVAHDFNNMLGVILGYAEMSLLEATKNSPLWNRLNEILRAAQRSSEITRQLLTFSRKGVISPRIVNLNAIIVETEKTLGRLIGEDITLEFKPASFIWSVKADPSQVHQILINLVVNSRDAMPKGGKLTIETNNQKIESPMRCCGFDVVPGEYVSLSVSDTGVGMSEEVQKNIFEPFFTTKEIGKGTGLGLATVYGIVSQNNGFICVLSKPNEGAKFTVYFPKTEEKETDVSSSGIQNLKGQGTIVLVEDDPAILQMTTQMLKGLGYTVFPFSNPHQAIELSKDKNQKIDLIITDILMPEMNGKEMMDQIAKIRPSLKSLFVSGYTFDVIATRGVLGDNVNLLMKPFAIDALAKKVKDLL